jgi:hypothetical protein
MLRACGADGILARLSLRNVVRFLLEFLVGPNGHVAAAATMLLI